MLAVVLLLTRLIGRDVLGSDGHVLGRLIDLTVRLNHGPESNLVERLVVTRRRAGMLVVPWTSVTHFDSGQVVLGTDQAVPGEMEPDEILLGRDVLDTQIVDVVGQRLARVADVLLARRPDSRLECLGVEVGFSGVVRRLGLGRIAPAPGVDGVAWSDLHLTSDRGHLVQLATARAAVHRLDARGLAALVSRVDTEAAAEILAVRDPGVIADVVRASHPDVAERMLRAMPGTEADRIVSAMSAEHAAPWRDRLAHRPTLFGRRVLRSRVWPHRRHLIRRSRQ